MMDDYYKGIKIIWDEDYDKRIYIFIDSLKCPMREHLVRCGESKGGLSLYWDNFIPMDFKYGGMVEIYDDGEYVDSWCIVESICLNIEPISRIILREDRYGTLKRQKWRCNFCNCVLKMSKHSEWEGEVAHIDHIHPFSKKDSYPNGKYNINESSNLQALCPKCNLSKSKKNIN